MKFIPLSLGSVVDKVLEVTDITLVVVVVHIVSLSESR